MQHCSGKKRRAVEVGTKKYTRQVSGKSYVVNCINFMFYGEIPFTKEATGYNKVSMLMESDDGY